MGRVIQHTKVSDYRNGEDSRQGKDNERIEEDGYTNLERLCDIP